LVFLCLAPQRVLKLKKFWNLTWPEKRLLFRAAAWLIWIRIVLLVLPYRRVQSLVQRWSAPKSLGPLVPWSFGPARIAYLIAAAANRIPGTNCLPRALVARILLSRAGHPAELHIGVSKTQEGKFEAHAWVECDGQAVIGGSDIGRYKAILRTGKDQGTRGTKDQETKGLGDQKTKGPDLPESNIEHSTSNVQR